MNDWVTFGLFAIIGSSIARTMPTQIHIRKPWQDEATTRFFRHTLYPLWLALGTGALIFGLLKGP